MTKISHKLEKQEQRFPKSFGDRTRWRLATTLRFFDQLDSDTGSTRQELPSIVAKKTGMGHTHQISMSHSCFLATILINTPKFFSSAKKFKGGVDEGQ